MREERAKRWATLIETDQVYWAHQLRFAGIDEVGRGPLIGCVMAACVVMPPAPLIEGVDDSKKLSEKKREALYEEIIKVAEFIGIGRAEAEEIDEINILNATKNAMRRATEGCHAAVYLVDAVEKLNLDGEEVAIVHGDALSYSIACASIVAKVLRDREMRQLHAQYPQYGLDSNKGYGTASHIEALKQLGPTPLHRRSFIKNFV